MTPREHYDEAQRCIAVIMGTEDTDDFGSLDNTQVIALAQVHATLATAQYLEGRAWPNRDFTLEARVPGRPE